MKQGVACVVQDVASRQRGLVDNVNFGVESTSLQGQCGRVVMRSRHGVRSEAATLIRTRDQWAPAVLSRREAQCKTQRIQRTRSARRGDRLTSMRHIFFSFCMDVL